MNGSLEIKRLLEISDIWRRYDQVFSRWAQQHGLSSNAMILIEELVLREDGAEPAEIADYLGIPRQTMTATLDSLESRGVVRRSPHKSDRRRKIVRFTEEGRAEAERLTAELHEWELAALACVSVRECAVTTETLKKLVQKMEELRRDGMIR